MDISSTTIIAVISSGAAVCTLAWGMYTYIQKSKRDQEERILQSLVNNFDQALDAMEKRIESAYVNGEHLIKENWKHMGRVEEDFTSKLDNLNGIVLSLSERLREVELEAVSEEKVKDMLEPIESDVAELSKRCERGFADSREDLKEALAGINNLALSMSELKGELRGRGELVDSRRES